MCALAYETKFDFNKAVPVDDDNKYLIEKVRSYCIDCEEFYRSDDDDIPSCHGKGPRAGDCDLYTPNPLILHCRYETDIYYDVVDCAVANHDFYIDQQYRLWDITAAKK
jgi:hypothetical protein